MITLQEAIEARHSVRKYVHKPLSQEIIDILQAKIEECNRQGNLHIQLVTNEMKAFLGMLSYGSFAGVENYFVMIGPKADDLDGRIGYYGELLVLLAQQLGLNTCWAGLSYRKVNNAYQLGKDEKIACMISLGYGMTQGSTHKIKDEAEVSNISEVTPTWFRQGVKAALLAPTAVNQQKFYFEYLPSETGNLPKVKASKLFSMIGFTQMDLGIAKLHFEIAAGKENFEWDNE